MLCIVMFIAKSNPVQQPPCVSLDLGPSIDSKDPWGQSFVICNKGEDTISDIWAEAYWNDPNVGKQMLFSRTATNPVEYLAPTIKQGLHFASLDGNANLPPFGFREWVNVLIHFTPALWRQETNQIFQFCVSKDSSGNYVWAYDGEGEDIQSLAKQMDGQVTKLADVMPLIAIGIASVSNIWSTQPEHPFQLEYAWANLGGRPAQYVYIEWDVYNRQTGEFTAWTNWGAVVPEPLWPNTPGLIEDRAYHDPHPPELYNGVMSGRLQLFGVCLYNDFEMKDYMEQVKIDKTETNFITRYLVFHTPLGDLYPPQPHGK